MFQELMPLLAQRILVLTVSRVNVEEICVNVIPRVLKADERDENKALTTPLSLTGTPVELDQEFPKQLVEFVGAHLQLSSTLRTAKEELAAAAKTAKEAAKKPTPPKPKITSQEDGDSATISEPADPSKLNPRTAPSATDDVARPATPSLFEGASHTDAERETPEL